MLVQPREEAYFNFVNSINSDATRRNYEYCMSRFLKYCNLDLDSLLKLSQQELSNLIIKYLVSQKISGQYKTVIMATIKHACEMNDAILNWKKLKKFIKSEKTDNEINGKDRGYTHEEIQKILEFSDQRLKTAFLVLASTGIRIGALQSIRIGDLERIDDLYKINVYRGDREEYITFCTPECAKEIDAFLDFRERRGEKITQDSYLLVRKFSLKTRVKGKPFKGRALWAILEDSISNSGLREIDHVNPYKRKQIPIFHGFRKFCTKQLVESKLNPEIREMLLGHKIGLASCYYKPTEQEMLQEYLKAVNLLTINEENSLKLKLEHTIQIESEYILNNLMLLIKL
jgi:integrase